jgi:molybdate transport system permease protein
MATVLPAGKRLMDASSLAAIRLSLELALATTLTLLVLGTPLAWWLARGRALAWLRAPVHALVALPLVLPPSVLGFYLLLALGPRGPLGGVTQALGWGTLAFTFWGLLIGSVIYSLPFVVQPITQAFEALGARPLEAAATLRAGPLDVFWHVALPLARPAYLSAAVMGFAHTLGEFGVVLMIGGNIAGQTRVISVQIYDHVEALEYAQAHWLAGGMLAFSFLALLALHWARGRKA